ncbi:antiterminator Q family protein [Gallibacterium sp. AGMB14963]|uniref:antiterminator Q family protein n=1 Tax=Gallibacterium faecale TaxID=3019086 RepID=UPI0022F18AA8|nr:antiterminator Q family protein [Gallibacterium sp. AGMB14963]MDA3979855.1 antiterminator Q family protein [Gallibacterium sp. AGMB14963]
MTRDELKERLKAWGNCVRSYRIGTEYPNKAMLLEGAEREVSYQRMCTDEEALEIEVIMRDLAKFDDLGYWMICQHYIDQQSVSNIMRKINKSKSYTLQILYGAESYVWGALSK